MNTPLSQISQLDSVDAGTGEGVLQFAQFAFPHSATASDTLTAVVGRSGGQAIHIEAGTQ